MPVFRSEGHDLAYVDVVFEGPAAREPVLLIHGFASNHGVNWSNTLWIRTLTEAGHRVVAIDNRGHGGSAKPHDVEAYHTSAMARDAVNLLDHLGLSTAHVMGYSMGARITAFAALAAPARVLSAVLGGLGSHLVDGVGLPPRIAEAMEAPSLDDVTDPMGRLFRRFADSNQSDLLALAACIRGSRQSLSASAAASITCPVLVAVGTNDPIAGDPHALARLLPRGEALDIPGRDHNLAVGDKVFKSAVLAFFRLVEEGRGDQGPAVSTGVTS